MSRGQTFSASELAISIVVIAVALIVVNFTPRKVTVQSLDALLVRGELYSIVVNALSHASRGGDFRSFLNSQMNLASEDYIPVESYQVRQVVIREGVSSCSVTFKLPYGYEEFEVYLEAELLSKDSYYDQTLNIYVVVLEVKVACDQYYPKSIVFYTEEGYRTSYYRESERYIVKVYMDALSPFKLYCVDWRGVQTYLSVSP